MEIQKELPVEQLQLLGQSESGQKLLCGKVPCDAVLGDLRLSEQRTTQ